MDGKRYQEGLGLLGWVFMIPVILIGLLVLAVIYCEANKAYWDHKVKQLCEKDGGVTVYEKIELTQDEFKRLGGNQFAQIPVRSERLRGFENSPYLSKQITNIVYAGPPIVRRFEFTIYRASDGKILGKMVNYARSGGDAFILDAGTSFSCADMKAISLDVERQVFPVVK